MFDTALYANQFNIDRQIDKINRQIDRSYDTYYIWGQRWGGSIHYTPASQQFKVGSAHPHVLSRPGQSLPGQWVMRQLASQSQHRLLTISVNASSIPTTLRHLVSGRQLKKKKKTKVFYLMSHLFVKIYRTNFTCGN